MMTVIYTDPNTSWPPPDPDRMPRRQYNLADHDEPFTDTEKASNINIQAFRERQQRDHLRFSNDNHYNGNTEIRQRGTFARSSGMWSDISGDEDHARGGEDEHHHQRDDEWRDADGDRLNDFGVDEEAEYIDEDDMPLSEIMKKMQKTVRKAQ